MKSIVLFVLCCMVGVLGNAKSKAKIDVMDAFLTYAQFQALTPTERISYIKDVRQFVYNLTKENDFFAGSPQGKALYAMINLFQAEAWAEYAGSVTVTTPDGTVGPTVTATEGQGGGTPSANQEATEKPEGGRGTQAPAPVVRGEGKTVSSQPSVPESATPSESASRTEPSGGGGSGARASTGGGSPAPSETTREMPTAISPAQALANRWAAEDMDPKKPCPGGRVSNLSKLSNQDLVNLIEAGIRACTAPAVYVGKRPEKLNHRGVYRPAAAENFVAVADELERRSRLNYKGKDREDLGQAVFLLRGALREFNDPMHQPPKGTYDAGKIETSVSRIDALVKKVEAADVGRGSGGSDQRPGRSRAKDPAQKSMGTVSKAVDSQPCIAAGFVNKRAPNGRCPFFSELPRELFFDVAYPPKFACTKIGEIICNPLLYGYLIECTNRHNSSAICGPTPLCVKPSLTATQECYQSSTKRNALENIKNIWTSSRGEQLYQEFVKSIKDLCGDSGRGSTSRSNDVVKTCQHALHAMTERVQESYRSTGPSRANLPKPEDHNDPRDYKANKTGAKK